MLKELWRRATSAEGPREEVWSKNDENLSQGLIVLRTYIFCGFLPPRCMMLLSRSVHSLIVTSNAVLFFSFFPRWHKDSLSWVRTRQHMIWQFISHLTDGAAAFKTLLLGRNWTHDKFLLLLRRNTGGHSLNMENTTMSHQYVLSFTAFIPRICMIPITAHTLKDALTHTRRIIKEIGNLRTLSRRLQNAKHIPFLLLSFPRTGD